MPRSLRAAAAWLVASLPLAPTAAQHDGHVVHAVALAPDASAAVFGRVTDMGGDGGLFWRDAGADEPRRLGRAGIVRALAFAPDGQSCFATDDSGRVHQTARDGSAIRTFELGRLPGFCRDVAVSADGTRLVVCDQENRVQCFDVASGDRQFGFVHDVLPLRAAFLPDGRWVLGDHAGVVTVWSAQGERLQRHRVLDSNVMVLAIAANGGRLAAGAWNGEVAVLDLASATVHRRAKTGERCYALAFDPEGRRLALAGGGPDVVVWSFADGTEQRWPRPRTIGALRWLPAAGETASRLVGADYRGGVHRLTPP